MPSNIEIKARLTDPAATRALAAAISDTPPQTLRQRDTFFRCETGRLKLRELGTGEAELIFYSRPDVAGAKQSDYAIKPVRPRLTARGQRTLYRRSFEIRRKSSRTRAYRETESHRVAPRS